MLYRMYLVGGWNTIKSPRFGRERLPNCEDFAACKLTLSVNIVPHLRYCHVVLNKFQSVIWYIVDKVQ